MPKRTTPGATMAPLNVVGSSTFGRYSKISSEKTYNMYISDGWLVNFSGYKKVLAPTAGGYGRGIFNSIRGGFTIVVINATVYKVSPALNETAIGTLETTSGPVFMAENLNNQICIVDGLNAYIHSYATSAINLTKQSLGIPGLLPLYVSYHNTRFLIGNGNPTNSGAKWYAYNYVNNTTIGNPQEFALQTKPDYAVAVVPLPGQGNNVLVLGRTVGEIHTQVSDFLGYQRNPTINIDYGCASVSTISSNDLYVAWLGINENNAPAILVYSGQGVQRISSDGIDYLLQELQYPEQSTAMFFRQDGHLFYQITFYNEADNLTLVYDFNTQKFFNLTDWDLNYHPAYGMVYFNKRSYFISLKNGALYEFGTEFTTYDDNIDTLDADLIHAIPRVRMCNAIRAEDSRRFIANSCVITIEQGNDPRYSALNNDQIEEIISEEGLFLVSEDGEEFIVAENSGGGGSAITSIIYKPRVDLSLSYDGGISWGNWVSRELNPLAKRQNMLTWEKMGATNDIRLKFRFVGTDRVVVNNGYVEIY